MIQLEAAYYLNAEVIRDAVLRRASFNLIHKVQGPTLDRAYLRQWAARVGVSDLLARTGQDAGLGAE